MHRKHPIYSIHFSYVNITLWVIVIVFMVTFSACTSLSLLKENRPTDMELGSIVESPSRKKKNHLFVRTPKTNDSLRVYITVKKTSFFTNFLINETLRKNESVLDSLIPRYFRVKLTLNELNKIKESILDDPKIDLKENKSYGLISSLTYLLPEKQLERLLLMKEVKYRKTDRDQYILNVSDFIGQTFPANFKNTFLIEYTPLHLCIQKKPFGQKSAIEIRASFCNHSNSKRKQLIKALSK